MNWRDAGWSLRSLALCAWAFSCQTAQAADLRRFDFEAPLMGTKFRISLYSGSKAQAEKAADAAFARIAALNAVYSDYEPNSELMKLCNVGAGKPFRAGEELYSLIGRALEIASDTDGAFDPTAGNLTRLWRRSRRLRVLPPEDRLQQALEVTDWSAVGLDAQQRTITLKKAGMLLDLGGIAKGRAADEALRVMAALGIERALVTAGGDMAVGEPPPGEDEWEVKLRVSAPPEAGEKLESVRVKRCGVSTSGDLYQFVEIGGARYSHIVSPTTGLGLVERVACTVIATDCTTSDALATAMCVLGEAKGRELAKRLGVQARFAVP